MSIEELAEIGIIVDRPLPDDTDVLFPDIEPEEELE